MPPAEVTEAAARPDRRAQEGLGAAALSTGKLPVLLAIQ